MRDLPALDGDVVEVDGRGLCAIPGLVDCHTHAAFGGDRVDEFSLRAGGASYEELHAARRRHPLDRPRDARARARTACAPRSSGTAAGCAPHGTTTFEAKSGYGLDRDTELASLRAIRDAGGVPTWLGAHAVPPEFDATPTRTSTSRSPRCCRRRREIAEAADVFLERGAFDAAQARRYLEACRDAGLALRLHGDQFTESGRDPARDRARRALGRPSRGDRRRRASQRSRRATSSACCCRRARSSSAGRCRRRERSSTPAPPSRSRPTSTPAARSARACRSSARSLRRSCSSSPAEALAACTVNAAHVLGRADRHRPARAGLPRRHRRCSTRPTGATSRTTSAATSSPGWSSAAS